MNRQLLNLNEEVRSRRRKLAQLRKQGTAFPNDFRRDSLSNELHILYDKRSNQELKKLDIEVRIAGRIMTRRIIGKASFITLQDKSGKIQLYISQNYFPEEQYNKKIKQWDLGDIIGARGKLFKTRTGELSVRCIEIRLLTKAIRPLPNKFHGLADQETRYRQRYLDLIVNDNSRQIFKTRSRIIAEIRRFMMDNDFIEVETPMIQAIPGGGLARPFITHYNALNVNMYLRIAPELYLKQLVVGGFERVFEINRNFRNEGLSPRHNPEFTMMEFYMAYADYLDLMKMIETLCYTLVQRVFNKSKINYGQQTFDFSNPFAKMTMKEAIFRFLPKIRSEELNDINLASAVAESLNIKINKHWGLGRIQAKIFVEKVQDQLIQPIFITSYPTEISPLARQSDDNPFFTDRFELFIGGLEIGNGFSELNDSEYQTMRFSEQIKSKEPGGNKTLFDEDYITALEYGLPPTAGFGIGIDRLIMILTNSHTIRDVILFPTMRPKKTI
ncbi:lysine--tRNA ligase [Sodalis sp. CWE]|uniref:lysine--tRNA ligase n=1 Tax=Sodalis sp. CWE TaxID=2803816 RepID=UPI001C7CB04A|nr:lysine--tRNA ligase [Sodalis sp. CWE]MBX4180887.1 lysine--tRNA ligase [Sodalis sp. CWE]